MNSLTHKRIIEREVEGFGIRLNKLPPNLTFRKKVRATSSCLSHTSAHSFAQDKGGINFTHTIQPTKLDLETVKAILGEYKIHNADIVLKDDCSADELIDVIEGSRCVMN